VGRAVRAGPSQPLAATEVLDSLVQVPPGSRDLLLPFRKVREVAIPRRPLRERIPEGLISSCGVVRMRRDALRIFLVFVGTTYWLLAGPPRAGAGP